MRTRLRLLWVERCHSVRRFKVILLLGQKISGAAGVGAAPKPFYFLVVVDLTVVVVVAPLVLVAAVT